MSGCRYCGRGMARRAMFGVNALVIVGSRTPMPQCPVQCAFVVDPYVLCCHRTTCHVENRMKKDETYDRIIRIHFAQGT